MQCAKGSSYSPCVSTCPRETCANAAVYERILATCKDDTCVEGCAVDSCPTGHVYKVILKDVRGEYLQYRIIYLLKNYTLKHHAVHIHKDEYIGWNPIHKQFERGS